MVTDDALVALVRERGPRLVGYAYLLTGDLHAAEDLVQDAVVRTFSRRRSGADVEWLEAYVRRAILNIYLDGYRKRAGWARIRHLVVQEAQAPARRAPDSIATDRADVHAALGRLSPRERACVVLRHFEDMTVPEVADTLGLNEGTVKRYLSEARARLGPMLTDEDRADVQIVAERSHR